MSTTGEDPAAGGEEARVTERVVSPPPVPRGRALTTTWWGRRWISALEDSALDSGRLPVGRRLVRGGAVGAVMLRPGRVTAVVSGKDGTAHRSDVLLRTFGPAEWQRLLDAVATEAGHLAALLDGEMPPGLVADAEAAEVELLPGVGDLEPECECGAWDHCEHTAALGYQVGRLLDVDPFLLLLLRGRDEREVVAGLRPAPSTGAAGGRDGVDARSAYAAPRLPLPTLPPWPSVPGGAPSLPPETSVEGVDAVGLAYLAAVAARRAARTLDAELGRAAPHSGAGHGDGEGAGGRGSDAVRVDPLWQDAAAMAAAVPPGPVVGDRLAAGCGRTAAELAMAAAAWSVGGAVALAVSETGHGRPAAWSGPRSEPALADAAEAWEEAGGRPVLRRSGVAWTAVGEGAQIRYGPDGRWWPFVRRGGRWWPAGGAEPGPAAATAVARSVAAEAAQDR
ncbi:SWF or SNF family helicase [Streptomyces spiramenti]|uniref:SWF or SNF family helicase n=1 Tax=Streptomyces spiramenti TaxID=2720606 RepID=A0ABX1AHF9_9ACTN|nr:SWF or SNF family helicase [Streptomyces spiramenti]NJP65635.1 SWF or SNF family helicase [Streptomyces spiramenti]